MILSPEETIHSELIEEYPDTHVFQDLDFYQVIEMLKTGGRAYLKEWHSSDKIVLITTTSKPASNMDLHYFNIPENAEIEDFVHHMADWFKVCENVYLWSKTGILPIMPIPEFYLERKDWCVEINTNPKIIEQYKDGYLPKLVFEDEDDIDSV